jgi:putative N-acetylmannosamine-6-phosphate epimerase
VTRAEFLAVLQEAPLVASVQASPGSPLADPETLLKLARASLDNGVRVLRLEGVASIRHIKAATGAPVIGLIKREYEGSSVYITPTRREVEELLATGCEVIALDATERPRPGGETLAELIQMVKAAGRLVMADVDSPRAAELAFTMGADFASTTLSGYTDKEPPTRGPDFRHLHHYLAFGPTFIEGRITQPVEVRAAMRMGAVGVVVGGALNDPVKQTHALAQAAKPAGHRVGAVDVGGTWLRWAVAEPIEYRSSAPPEAAFMRLPSAWGESAARSLSDRSQIPLPRTHGERIEWIESQIRRTGVSRVGVSAGGTIRPSDGLVWESSEIIPDQTSQYWRFSVPSLTLNDGLATAWGHAGLPSFADRRVFTIALGTGVGGGFTDGLRLMTGKQGEYPRINDLRLPSGRAEDVLGGLALGGKPPLDIPQFFDSLQGLIDIVRGLYAPEDIVLCGGVGFADWFGTFWSQNPDMLAGVCLSPFGTDAGLQGAAALALWPPELP